MPISSSSARRAEPAPRPLAEFHPVVRQWFERHFAAPTPAQVEAWPAIREGLSTLVAAPTGSGKTLTAFLAAIDALVVEGLAAGGELADATQVVYVSPLKALSNDIRINLEQPLAGIHEELARLGLPDVDIRSAVRTGDTPQVERGAMRKRPPHILVTTPESLYILLGSESGRQMLAGVRSVIVDEIHALAGSKRGSHLALSLERLQALCPRPLLRIGLSATQKPIEKVARFLVGASGNPRDPACRIVDIGYTRPRDLGIELQFVQGSGPAGRVLHEDLDAYLTQDGSVARSGGAAQGYAERHDEQAVPVIGLRRKIAQKMQDAKRRIPHFSYVEEIDVTDLEALRAHLNQKWGGQRGKLTLLPFLVRAMVVALRDFPQLNARYDDEAEVVTRYGAVHVGIATQSDNGLMVPVLRHAESRDLWGNASEVARLAEAARSGKAQRQELSGSTITLSSLGALGGIVSTPVINHPEVAIVGVNRIVERPMVVGGNIVVRKMMNLSSSFDHRVVDGMDAAAFIQAVRGLLEHPATLFLE